MMYEYNLTVGLFDKDECIQLISSEKAYEIIDQVLLDSFGIFAYTAYDVKGHYRMNDGRRVAEPSIRIEIESDENIIIEIQAAIEILKDMLNQESIMLKVAKPDVSFL